MNPIHQKNIQFLEALNKLAITFKDDSKMMLRIKQAIKATMIKLL